jgi:hypothetical protein
VLLAAAGPAAAHGEEIVFMPAGNLVALVVVFITALRVKAHWAWRALAVVLGVLAGLPPYFATNEYVPYWVASSGVAWFVVGFAPPLALSGLLLVWRSRAAQRSVSWRPPDRRLR